MLAACGGITDDCNRKSTRAMGTVVATAKSRGQMMRMAIFLVYSGIFIA
jgi:hypothetical protein